MNCLSLLLNKAAEDGKFSYHYKCNSTKLTHLCFADDLLIFCDGSLSSVQSIMDVLQQFKELSGLAISLPKTSFFAAGLSLQDISLISSSTGLATGTLPVRYLGVPLCTKKLSLLNCEPLLSQIKGKITSWSARSLSYAGRLLLITSVVEGITNFWASTFILPKACIKKINAMCSAYLWKGTLDGHHSARVAWTSVTKTKDQGGLGIKDLLTWNKACSWRLVWLLFFRSGSIWVAWYTMEVLNGSVHNLWSRKERIQNSWMANKIIRMRDSIYQWIKLRVENGTSCRFWFDNWSPFGNMNSFLRTGNSSTLGIPLSSTLSSLYRDGTWTLPPARSENQVNLQAYLTTLTLTEESDYYEWEIDGKVEKKYNTGQVYEQLTHLNTLVPWSSAVWIKGGIPRQSFLCWLFVLNRCPTRDRILGWGLQTDPLCLLCSASPESRNHLLFECQYSWYVWSRIAARALTTPFRDWTSSLNAMQLLKGSSPANRLSLLAWQVSIYNIWSERNSRLHRSIFRPPESLMQSIDLTIRNRISTFRETNPRLRTAMMERWLQP